MDEHDALQVPFEQSARDPGAGAAQFLVVGLGASAGGVEALQAFFTYVAADTGMAYVVILHLSPDHDSQLAHVLQAVTPMPVAQVTERVRVEPNHVYVIPPNQHLLMLDSHIAVAPTSTLEERRAPVDLFFRTLADSHGARAVCVVLSGTGANGSMGLKRVKEHGGAVFAQDPREAAYDEMPRNAIATNLVDEVLPVAAIPDRIVAYAAGLGSVAIPVEPEQRPEDQQQALREVFAQLRLRTGHDFSHYKRPTLLRRVERRISVYNLPDLPAYATFLRENPDEAHALLKDLLISVTNFFRDKEAFEALENDILPTIFHGKTRQEPIRVWVVGCATGEEAYSLGMLFAERTFDVLDAPKIQIFATDIDEAALAHARQGRYTLNDAADVSPERLRRFFTRDGDGYRVTSDIREMVLFANHNVIKDPPFSHLDLVTCRNLLIYLDRTAQERVIETLHFALNSGGYLFLGTSESVDGASDLFASISREHHIFRSRPTRHRSFPVPESVPAFRLAPPQVSAAPHEQEHGVREPLTLNYGDLHLRLLQQYAPASLIVDEDYTIVHLSGRAGRYVQLAEGAPSNNLLTLIRPELRLELRNALYQAVQRQTNVTAPNLSVRIDDQVETITIQVRPVLRDDDPARGFVLILFEPSATPASDAETVVRSDTPVARHLEEEVLRLRAQLRTANEGYETHAEELKSTNEELQATVEELRSAAEELETSREELQSINEELRTVNQELKVKVDETTQANNNLHNLVNSTNIGTIFLDRSFRIALFTPAATELFNLIGADRGRPLSDITHRLVDRDVLADAERVLGTLQPIEREVSAVDGRVFLMRVLPFRAGEDRIGGVVITFVDITERKRAEEAVRESEAKYRTLFETMNQGFGIAEIIVDDIGQPVDYRMLEINPQFEQLTGQSRKEFLSGRTVREVAPELEEEWYQFYGAVGLTGEPAHREIHAAAWNRWFEVSAYRTGSPEQRHVAILYTEITERKRRERNLAFRNELQMEFARLITVEEITETAAQRIAEHLNLSRCLFVEIDAAALLAQVFYASHDDAAGNLVGSYTLTDFHTAAEREQLMRGEPVVINNVRDGRDPKAADAFEALGTRSLLTVSYLSSGRWKFALSAQNKQPRQWTADEAELLRELAAQFYLRLERARAEAALRESEEKYRSLFESIDEGFAIVEVFPDEHGRVADMIWREANEGVERHAGISGWVGKRASEIVPNLEQHWLDAMTGVYQTGEPVRMEAYIADLNRWIETYYARIGGAGSNLIAAVFDNITERKRHEANLAFLAEVSQDLVHLTNIDETMDALGAKIGGYFNVARVIFSEISEDQQMGHVSHEWHAADLPDMKGTYATKDYFSPEFELLHRRGEIAIVADTAHDERVDAERYAALGVLAFVGVPLIREQKWRFYFSLLDSRPHTWRDDEIELMREIVARIWIRLERARVEEALRESQARQTIILETMAEGVVILDREDRFVSLNRAAERILGMPRAELIERSAGEPPFQRLTLAGEPWIAQPSLAEIEAAGDRVFQNEYMIERRDGSRVVISRTITALRDNQEQCVGFVSTISDITERKRVDDALRDSEARLRAMIENLPGAAAFIVDRDLRYMLAEGEALRAVDTTPEQYIGKTIYEVLEPEQAAEYEIRYRQALNGESFTHEHQVDGHSFFSRGVPLRNAYGEVYAVLVVSYDITERLKGEQALRDSETRFRTLADTVPQLIWTNDSRGQANYFNQRWYDYSGLSYEQSAGVGWQAIAHPDDAPPSIEHWRLALAKGDVFEAEYRLRRADGAYRWFVGRNVPLHNENGQITGWFGSATDIEDLKQAEVAIRESEERFRLLVEGARDYAMLMLDPAGRITYWSSGGERVFGWSQAEAVGQSGALIFTPEDRERGAVEREMRTALDTGRAEDRRWHLCKDESRIFVDGMLVRLDDPAGNVRGFVKIARDATAQRQAEEALQSAKDELETRVQERISELAAANDLLQQEIGERRQLAAQRAMLLERIITEQESERQRISHELHDTLGQFLSALNMRLSMTQSLKGVPSEVSEEFAQLLRLSSQIDREVDRLTMELRPPALEDLGLAAALHSYTAEWSATSGVPVDLLVVGFDSTRLAPAIETTVYRIVQEALTNVLKHAQASVVSVVVERRPGGLSAIVEDNGVGYDASAIVAPGAGGRQVGLIGMLERAALVGGELTIESAPGAGTTIYLYIPLGEDTTEETGDRHAGDSGAAG